MMGRPRAGSAWTSADVMNGHGWVWIMKWKGEWVHTSMARGAERCKRCRVPLQTEGPHCKPCEFRIKQRAAVAQLVEPLSCKQEVDGSTPSRSLEAT